MKKWQNYAPGGSSHKQPEILVNDLSRKILQLITNVAQDSFSCMASRNINDGIGSTIDVNSISHAYSDMWLEFEICFFDSHRRNFD